MEEMLKGKSIEKLDNPDEDRVQAWSDDNIANRQ